MRYQNSSAIAYFFRNFWKYVYIVLPVSIFMAIFATFSSESAFLQRWSLNGLSKENYINAMMKGFSLVRQVDQWWYGIVIYLLAAITFSLLVVKVSRHMRVGGFVLLPFKSALKVIPSMLIYCGGFAVATILLEFVAFGLMYALNTFLPMNAVIIIGLVLLFLAKMAVVYFWMLTLLSFPLYYSENYRFNIALSYSIREMSKHQGVCIGHAFLYTAVQALVVLLDYLFIAAVGQIIHGLFFGLVFYYIPCLAFTIHHKTLGSERKDIARVIVG